jgi:DNA-binding NtrC family response regulator
MHHATASHFETPQLIGQSPEIVALRNEIAVAARTSAKVLILGETGVGKEVAARLLHEQSARRTARFVPVNCSGVTETLLESELFGHVRGSFTDAFRDKPGLVRQAGGGTLFLDELGEMSLRMQAVLLRFTETGEIQPVGADAPVGRVDVRLITATNRDLRELIAAGAFRDDLFYRLNVIQIRIPPLRDRGEDILLLMRHYLEHAAVASGLPVPEFTSAASQVLLEYQWPGNIREVRNIAERLALRELRRPIAPDDLPAEMRDAHGATGTSTRQDLTAPLDETHAAAVDTVWNRMANGEDFWTVVHKPFKQRELTRKDLASLIDRGLTETWGSYRALLKVFRIASTDYKRFHAFLYQQHCNLPVAGYRRRFERLPRSLSVFAPEDSPNPEI